MMWREVVEEKVNVRRRTNLAGVPLPVRAVQYTSFVRFRRWRSIIEGRDHSM
ncbi:hypothetical protein ACFT1A_26400 [Rhodococcus sp. NPDC057135]|uniref:hypothetical protein n=1 Tax=Rhodococcus sp. NPDC057135 TaxID=3346028 RepID=UPI00362979F7